MRHYHRNQIDQDKILNDSCYIISALMASALKFTLL